MRITLSSTESARWLAGGPDAWLIEHLYPALAQALGITEPIVVCLADGTRAFEFCAGGDQ
jgi:hypothetical protein